MQPSGSSPLPIVHIHRVMRDDFRDRITLHALRHRHKAPPAVRHRLEQELARVEGIPGYRSARRAPAELAARRVAEIASRSEALTRALLHAWVCAQADLYVSVRSFLESQGISLSESVEASGFSSTWQVGEMLRVADSICSVHEGLDLDDVCLMLCWQTGRLPVQEEASSEVAKDARPEDEGGQGELAETGGRWGHWLAELRALPADAPEWADLEAFIDAVAEVAQEKRAEAIARAGLLQAVADLSVEAEEIGYFQLGDPLDWLPDERGPGQATEAIAYLQELKDLLAEHRALRHSRSATITEDMQRASRQDALAKSILRIASRLSAPMADVQPGSGRDREAPTSAEVPQEERAHIDTDSTSRSGTRADEDQLTHGTGAPPEGASGRPDQKGDAEPQRVDKVDASRASEAVVSSPPEGAGPGEMDGARSSTGHAEVAAAAREQREIDGSVGEAGSHGKQSVPLVGVDHRSAELPSGIDLSRSEGLCDRPELKRTSRGIAGLLQAGGEIATWDDFLWALVAEDDLTGALWLLRSLAASGRAPEVPDWLLLAVQGARWLMPATAAYECALFDLAQRNPIPESDCGRGLALAAALQTCLSAPNAGLLGWLQIPSWADGLHGLVSAIEEFAQLGHPLRQEDLRGAVGQNRIEASIAAAAEDARRWLEDHAPHHRVKYQRATDIWLQLIGPSGGLREMLLPVMRDRRDEVNKVRSALVEWQSADRAAEHIERLAQQLAGVKYRPIVGAALQQLNRYAAEACEKTLTWCDLVERQHDIEIRGNWLYERVQALREAVATSLPEASHQLGLLLASSSPGVSGVATCIARSLGRLCATLDVPYASDALPPALVSLLPAEHVSLDAAIARRLCWLPEILLESTCEPAPGELPKVADALVVAHAEARTASLAIRMWLDKQDYRFIEFITESSDANDVKDVSRRLREALEGSRASLIDAIDETLADIEQALVDGVIGDERAEYAAVVEAIDPDTVLDFSGAFERLRTVREALTAQRRKRLEDLGTQWQDLSGALKAQVPEPEHFAHISQMMEKTLAREDTRVVEESIASLKSYLDGSGVLPKEMTDPEIQSDILARYVEASPDIEKWLESPSGLHTVARGIAAGQTRAGMAFGGVPSARRDEAVQALNEWQRLKQLRPRHGDNPDRVAAILRYLGFTLGSSSGAAIRVEDQGPDWLYMRASMSASDLAKPIPQFGHQAGGLYHVACFWERPGGDTIAARLRELHLTTRTVIVFYLGRLTARQRRDVSRIFRQQDLSVAVLDEILMVFLAQERDARLGVFLRCTLPYSSLNPYTPFQAGDVPPEMFFGRGEIAAELQRPSGSCLVYGGRQLGKSALLRHVQRQFHHPDRGQYAWVENMKLIYDPQEGQSPEQVWLALRDAFKREGLLSAQIRTNRVGDIRRRILESIATVEGRRVLVMLDEADGFLDADAANGFAVVTGLRELMIETGRRLKVVFAGLHSVQRFQGIPDQPLAHFGSPICVGPLEAPAARDLVCQPLDALGYRFDDPSVILRVLSYTNYHPGLIQLFCQELLRQLLERTAADLPPYMIRRHDVEAVYRRPEVRDRIRERFDWTLALDARYQAIAWSLIVDQMERHDSYALSYSPGDILTRVVYWWPKAFRSVGVDELSVLLHEMSGLGVLVRNLDGHYRLRSPNLVRLMGTEEDVADRLLELSEKDPPTPPEADSHHGCLDIASAQYSPLTYVQERALRPPRVGVGMVFASQAGGMDFLPEAFRRFVPSEAADGVLYEEVPRFITSVDRLRTWLSSQEQTKRNVERGVIYAVLRSQRPGLLEDMVKEVQRYCRCHQSQNRWLRILLVLDPHAAWAWLNLPEEQRVTMENEADYVTHLRPWDLSAIRQLLAQREMMHSDDICEQVGRVTGGWHLLLQDLLARTERSDDPRDAVAALGADFWDEASALRQKFVDDLGLAAAPGAKTAITVLASQVGPKIPLDFLTPDLLGELVYITYADCRRAVQFLERMGCATVNGDELVVDPLVYRVLTKQW